MWGEKAPTHVFLSEFGASVDTRDLHPGLTRFWRQVGAISRVVALDRRGLGASDVVTPYRFDRLDEYVADILAVIDAIGVERVVITGEGSSCAAAVLFAVTYPERVERLAIVNGAPCASNTDDYRIAPFEHEDIIAVADGMISTWGTGSTIATFSPGLASDDAFLETCGRIERFVCSPSTASAWGRAAADLDIREFLPRVAVPTLVYFTGDLLVSNVEQSRDLADRIPGAQLVEVPGKLFYLPDDNPQLDVWASFIGGRIDPDPVEDTTMLFVDVVGSTVHAEKLGDVRWLSILDDLDAFVSREVVARGGRIVKQTGDGHLALFDRAEDALATALLISRGVHALGVEVRTGVHAGEVALRGSGDIGGLHVHLAARVMDAAGARQVFASESIAQRVNHGRFTFEDRGEFELKGVSGRHRLLEVLEPA